MPPDKCNPLKKRKKEQKERKMTICNASYAAPKSALKPIIRNILGAGTHYYPAYCDEAAQWQMLDALAEIVKNADFFTPYMPHTGRAWSIKMSNCGVLGWVADKSGYRYQATHPQTNVAWPPIPPILLDLWHNVTNYPAPPQCCLINYYDKPHCKMGLHQDRDETALDAPVVSLGDSALFRMAIGDAGAKRTSATQSLKLHSGDVFCFGGAARLHFHGIDRILFGSSRLLNNYGRAFAGGGRLNLTLRRVSKN